MPETGWSSGGQEAQRSNGCRMPKDMTMRVLVRCATWNQGSACHRVRRTWDRPRTCRLIPSVARLPRRDGRLSCAITSFHVATRCQLAELNDDRPTEAAADGEILNKPDQAKRDQTPNATTPAWLLRLRRDADCPRRRFGCFSHAGPETRAVACGNAVRQERGFGEVTSLRSGCRRRLQLTVRASSE